MSKLDNPRFRKHLLLLLTVMILILTGTTGFFAYKAHGLHSDRKELRADLAATRKALDEANARNADLTKQLETKTTQLAQLTGDAQGKDAVIKTLQDDNAAKQAAIDSLTQQKSDLKGCLDGLTLALVQLTNSASSTAHSTLDGARDVCNKAQVQF